jgi:LAS superfamily LD-carboxypeptidase LdcB
MQEHFFRMKEKYGYAFLVTTIILLLAVGYCIYNFLQVRVKNFTLENKVTELEEALRNSNDSLTRVQGEKDSLTNALSAAGQKNQNFALQLDKINTDLETYQRLSQTDPELLQKYSKVYFLNENYIPSALTVIDTKYLANKERPQQFHDRVWPFLKRMLDDAAVAEAPITVVSAFRSFGTQATLKSAYKVTYGAGSANAFSADQGYSEHQLGTAIDFSTPTTSGNLTGFEKTKGYTWLTNNAHRYGFILSYPPNNAYYVYEPWHWRFVGLDFADKLHNENKRFYDLDQRDISPFLANFFNDALTGNSRLP